MSLRLSVLRTSTQLFFASGVQPDAPELLQIAAELERADVPLRGVLTHAGSSYDCRSVDAIRGMARQERDAIVHAAGRLRAAGMECPVVSLGSTPTALFAESLEGVTELRAGVYVFFDLVMAGLNVCRTDEIALSVLATVIGHQHEKGWTLLDAGWIAFQQEARRPRRQRHTEENLADRIVQLTGQAVSLPGRG